MRDLSTQPGDGQGGAGEWALLRSEMHFRRLLDVLPAGAYTCDSEGLITYFNQQAVQIWGREPRLRDPVDRFCGSFKLFAADGAPLSHEACWMALALKHEKEYNGQEIIVERPDGQRRTALAHANPIRDEYGNLLGAVNVLVDISDRKRVEEVQRESEERFRAAVEGSLSAFFALRAERDDAGEIVDFTFLDLNTRGEQLIGYSREQAVGERLLELLPANRDLGFFDKYRRVVETREPIVEEFGQCAAGHVGAWFWQQVVPLGDGIAITTADFTERKRAEAELEERLRQITLVHDLSTKVTRATHLDDVYSTSLDVILEATRADRAAVLLFDEDDVIRFKAWRGLSDAYRAAVEGHSPWRPGDADAAPITVPDVAADASLSKYREVILREGIRALLFIPLVYENRLLGKFMVYAQEPRSFSTSELQLAHTIANHVAFAIGRKQGELALRTSEQKLRSIMDASAAVVFVKDLDGRYAVVNRAWSDLFGIPEAEGIGKTDLDLFPEHMAHMLQQNDRRVLEAAEPLSFEEWADIEGRGRVMYISVKFPLRDAEGNVYGVGGISTDITELKRVQEALRESEERYRRLNLSLEQHVAARTDELARANETLAQRNRELQDFAQVASHDLQEPLRKFRTFLDLLRMELDTPSETVQDYIRRMESSAQRMSELTTALLLLARVATRAERFRPTDLEQVIRGVLADLEVSVAEAGAAVEVGPLCTVEADPMQMRQLFQNLIGNALKFRRADVRPVLRIRAEASGMPANGVPVCRITVEDNGIGFEERYVDRIFSPFQRLHGRGAYEGTGMGLAICRRIVERHGGTITVRSTPGAGSAFTVTLPLQQPASLPKDVPVDARAD